jgi:CDP-paratose 2-epimerase
MGKVVVTGGAGFVGSHAAEYFARAGHEVVVFDNLSRAHTLGTPVGDQSYNWNYLKSRYSAEMLLKDVRDFQAVREAFKDANVVIHAAAQVAVTTSLSDPRTDFEVNALGTFNVLEAARLNDSTVVFCSTNKVYGENVNIIPVIEKEMRYSFSDSAFTEGIAESFPVDHTGHSPYGSSKLSADIYVQDYAHTYGLKTGVFRMSCIYGERQFGAEDQGWVAWFAIATLTSKPITIYGNGKQVRDVLYVEDLVKAFDCFLSSNARHEVFNMGGGPDNTLSLLELLHLLQELTDRAPKIQYSNWRPADQKVYVSDIQKAEQKLGWKPSVNPVEGVNRLAHWVGQNLKLFA